MLLIAQYADATGFQHHGKRKVHGILQPSLDERTKKMAVSNKYDVTRGLASYVGCLETMYLIDQAVEAGTYFLCRPIEQKSELDDPCLKLDTLTLLPHIHLSRCPTASPYPSLAPSAKL